MTTNTIDANNFLMGGGKSAAFPTIGASIAGRVTATPDVRQQTEPDGKPRTFDNGDPMMQLVVQLATDQRDPQVADDDGARQLFIKSNMLVAVREAVRRSGAKGIEVGGTIAVTYIGDGEKKRAAHSAPKLYSATYAPPTAQAANDYLMGGNTNSGTNGNGHQAPPLPASGGADAYLAAQQQTAAAALAAVQAASAPAPVGPPPPGIDPTVWAQLDPTQRASVLAATNNVRV